MNLKKVWKNSDSALNVFNYRIKSSENFAILLLVHPCFDLYYKAYHFTKQKTGEQYLPGSVILYRILSSVGTRLYGVPIYLFSKRFLDYTFAVDLVLAESSPLAYLAANSSKGICLILLAWPAVPNAS